MSDISNDPYTALLSIIDELQSKLINYSKLQNCDKNYLKRQQNLIDSLTEVSNGLDFYNLHPVYTRLQSIINETLRRDPEIQSFQINLNLKPVTNKISIIDLNIF